MASGIRTTQDGVDTLESAVGRFTSRDHTMDVIGKE